MWSRWYCNGHVCIVYLYLAQSASVEDCDNDDWCVRGWMLQEMLAPLRIKFFRRGWQPLTWPMATPREECRTSHSFVPRTNRSARPLKSNTRHLMHTRGGQHQDSLVTGNFRYSLRLAWRQYIRVHGPWSGHAGQDASAERIFNDHRG
ncbi:hypothetical protein BDR03DRAFT_78962 [Suillus americanus]|nr:hypothetical protein BDR03DRAFT_78962 [Suillus americanus]